MVWRWHAYARSFRTPVTWNAWPGFCGRCRPASTCTRTRACSKRRQSWRSIAATSKNSTVCWNRTTSRRTTIPNSSRSGSKVTTSRRKNCAEDRSAPSGNTASGVNSLCRALSGTARRRRTVSRRSRGRCWETGTLTTRTRRRGRRGSWPRRLGWRRHRCRTGSRTGDKEIVLPSLKTGRVVGVFTIGATWAMPPLNCEKDIVCPSFKFLNTPVQVGGLSSFTFNFTVRRERWTCVNTLWPKPNARLYGPTSPQQRA